MPGHVSAAEEAREDAIEKATFVFPASQFGQAAETAANLDKEVSWDWLTKEINTIQIDSQSILADDEMPGLEASSDDSDCTINPMDQNIADIPSTDSDETTVHDSIISNVDLTDKSIRTKTHSVRPHGSINTNAMSIASTDTQGLNRPIYVPDSEQNNRQSSSNKATDDGIRRPKKAFRGRAFLSFGNAIKPLHGTEIFPLSPKQEKFYFKVASNSSIDHYDGELDQTFLDDIKRFMNPIMESLSPEDQKDHTFLNRIRIGSISKIFQIKFYVLRKYLNFIIYCNFLKTMHSKKFSLDWKTKFPYAGNRIGEYNFEHVDDETFSYKPYELDANLYDNYRTKVRFKVESFNHKIGGFGVGVRVVAVGL